MEVIYCKLHIRKLWKSNEFLIFEFPFNPQNLYNGSCPRYISKVLYHVQNYFLNDFNNNISKLRTRKSKSFQINFTFPY